MDDIAYHRRSLVGWSVWKWVLEWFPLGHVFFFFLFVLGKRFFRTGIGEEGRKKKKKTVKNKKVKSH